MQTLNQDIKDRTFKPVCFLFSGEAFLEKSYKSRLREALTSGDTMNYNHFEGKGMNVNEIIGLADIMSSFVEKRLVSIEGNGSFKGGTEADEPTEYMEGIPESTCLISVESEVDKRSRLYKAVKKCGYAAKLNHREPVQFARWATGILPKNGRKIIGCTMGLSLSKTGDDAEDISSGLEKLINYTLGREVIIDEDVETTYITQVANRIFDTMTTVTARQTREVMDLYEDLLTLKEPPMRILSLIAGRFNQIPWTKDLMGKGMDKSTIAPRLKLQPFVTRKIVLQAKIFTREQILSHVDLCVDAEEGVKTGKLQDRLAMELLIIDKYERK